MSNRLLGAAIGGHGADGRMNICKAPQYKAVVDYQMAKMWINALSIAPFIENIFFISYFNTRYTYRKASAGAAVFNQGERKWRK